MNKMTAAIVYSLPAGQMLQEPVQVDCSGFIRKDVINRDNEEEKLGPVVAYLYQCMLHCPQGSKFLVPKWVRSYERLRSAVSRVGLEVEWL